MLDHSEAIERFSDFLEDDLAPGEAERVREHLATCEPCRGALERVRLTLQGLRSLPEHPAPPDLVRRVRHRVRRRTFTSAGYGGWQQELLTAAVLALLVGTTVAVSGRLLEPAPTSLQTETVSGLVPAATRAVAVHFGESDRAAVRAFVTAAADLGGRSLDGEALRPGAEVPSEGAVFVVPEAALSVMVPEGVARLEPLAPQALPDELRGDPERVPSGWVVVRVLVH